MTNNPIINYQSFNFDELGPFSGASLFAWSINSNFYFPLDFRLVFLLITILGLIAGLVPLNKSTVLNGSDEAAYSAVSLSDSTLGTEADNQIEAISEKNSEKTSTNSASLSSPTRNNDGATPPSSSKKSKIVEVILY